MSRSRRRLLGNRLIRQSSPISFLAIAALVFIAPAAIGASNADPLQKDPLWKHWAESWWEPQTVVGAVSNSLTGQGIPGATVTFKTLTVAFDATTDASGNYTIEVPAIGYYDVSFEATNYNTHMVTGGLIPASNVVLNAVLEPVAPVIVDASLSGTPAPGATLSAMGDVVILDGSTIVSMEWAQHEGAPAQIASPSAATTSVTLADMSAYKDELLHLLKEPPITEAQLPPNVPPPPGDEFYGGLQDRYQVVGINHFALERAEELPLELTVTTTSGTYTASADTLVHLPWGVSTGLKTVPTDAPVLLYGKENGGTHSWTFASAPGNSNAQLMDPNTQAPWFTPDVPGVYDVMEAQSGESVTVHVGPWLGVLAPQETLTSVLTGDGKPEGFWVCLYCHNDIFESWRQTGHAEIFTDNVNSGPGGHYSSNCFGCHTVGHDPEADNQGFDDTAGYQMFLDAGLLNNNPETWSIMLSDFPGLASKSNIQCENCHGPQDNPALGTNAHIDQPGAPRVSLSSDVCASCHAEPLRHARFQQWQLSRHSNYELAIDEGGSGNCSRCHTANGFLSWLPVLLGDVPGDPLDNVEVTWTEDETHPQTCVVCHDPHEAGNTSGIDTNAKVRISGSTPLLAAGFQAIGVGKGAMCMTCHNTRRGLRDESTWATTTDRDRAPHLGVQTDVLMGRNVYFLDPNQLAVFANRAGHSYVKDTCVACHMVATPPPDILSYNQGGTNHTFFASLDSCSECHGEGFSADGVQSAVGAQLDTLEGMIAAYYRGVINSLLAAGNTIDANGEVVISDPAALDSLHLTETHGRQALLIEYGGTTYEEPVRMTDMDVVGPDGPATLFDFIDETVTKANWNYLLIHGDTSKGIHNPSFSIQAVQAATNAVMAM